MAHPGFGEFRKGIQNSFQSQITFLLFAHPNFDFFLQRDWRIKLKFTLPNLQAEEIVMADEFTRRSSSLDDRSSALLDSSDDDDDDDDDDSDEDVSIYYICST